MKRHPFNLIELLLALGVIVVGLVSVMALFPIGASTNRDAMAENYSAQAAEQMLNSLAFYMRSSNARWNAATASIPVQAGTAAANQIEIETQAAYFAGGGICKLLDGGANTVFWETDGDFSSGFRIENRSGTSGNPVDFEAMIALWHEPIELGATPTAYPNISTTLHVEISWPVRELPASATPAEREAEYKSRRKARYSLQVFNPNH